MTVGSNSWWWWCRWCRHCYQVQRKRPTLPTDLFISTSLSSTKKSQCVCEPTYRCACVRLCFECASWEALASLSLSLPVIWEVECCWQARDPPKDTLLCGGIVVIVVHINVEMRNLRQTPTTWLWMCRRGKEKGGGDTFWTQSWKNSESSKMWWWHYQEYS